MNPYEPPAIDPEPPAERGTPAPHASRGVRLANLLVDSLCRFSIWLLLPLLNHPKVFIPISMIWMVGYYFIFESVFQVTPGKLFTGTRVVDWDGTKPTWMQILGRSLVRFIPFEPFSFFGSTGDGWHDRWSGTRVVKR